ncbi:MAG: flagellar motor protein MotD [Proteobacteria bacterium]|nr:flagellar motor protein MotD [Pseudomonadota bacterium]
MRRRRTYLDNRESDNHDRWLVSYADFITLLFAFFVVMYALSSVNEGKYRVLSDSLTTAFQSKVRQPGVAQTGALPETQTRTLDIVPRRISKPAEPQRKQREEMRSMAQDILKVLDSLVREGQVKVTQTNRGISVEISASVLFATGQAQLRPDSIRALQQVARVLTAADKAIQIEGYTDNIPIGTAQFPSNWELSGARASSVARLFIDNGVLEERLSVIGYGPNRAVASNDSAEGRARNRRVTVMILEETPGNVVEIPLSQTTGQKP